MRISDWSSDVCSSDLILDLDPELLLPYLLDRRGRSQQAILELLTPRLAAGQAAGHIRDGNPELLARTILLTAHRLTLSAHQMGGAGIDEAALAAEFTGLQIGRAHI